MNKVRSLEQLLSVRESLKKEGKTLVLTNGCFDLLHAGHLVLLRQAKSLGDRLVVALNSDASVRNIKGQGRPILSQEERAATLAALDWVDYLLIFGDDTAERVVEFLKPDVYVKGGDYAPSTGGGAAQKTLPEAKILKSYGGEVALVPLVEGYSTTDIIRRIRSSDAGG